MSYPDDRSMSEIILEARPLLGSTTPVFLEMPCQHRLLLS